MTLCKPRKSESWEDGEERGFWRLRRAGTSQNSLTTLQKKRCYLEDDAKKKGLKILAPNRDEGPRRRDEFSRARNAAHWKEGEIRA